MIKNILKFTLLLFITLSFSACEDKTVKETQTQEVKYKASLPIPEWDKEAKQNIDNYWSNWNDAKKDPIAATQIGYAYSEQLNDYNKALQWYKYSNSMKPLPENSNYACYALQQLKQYNEAIQWCEDAIKLGSDEALIGLGFSYSKLNQYDEAIKWYTEASKKNHPDAFINLGSVYFNKKDYANSEKYYKKAIENNDYQAYQGIARLYHHGLYDDIKASAYAIAVINTKYTKSSVLGLLQDEWEIPNDIIQKGYELQLNSPEFPVKYDGELDLE